MKLLHDHTVQQAADMGITVRIAFREPFDVYLANAKRPTGRRQGLSELSYKTYQQILWQFYAFCTNQEYTPQRSSRPKMVEPEFDGRELVRCIVPFLNTMTETRNFTNSTYNKYVAVLRAFIKEIGHLYDLPKTHLPKFARLEQPLPLALSDREVHKLLNIARSSNYGTRAFFLVSFLLATGLRRNEFVTVRLRDLDLDNPSVRVVGKGGKSRIVPLPPTILPILRDYLDMYHIQKPTDYLYPRVGDPSAPIRGETLDRQAARMFQKLDTYDKNDPLHAYSVHSLRHTYATKLLRKGVSLRAIAQALGHSSVETTKIYTVLNVDGLREQLGQGLDVMSEWWRGGFQ
jgi:integrase/recombinase XerC